MIFAHESWICIKCQQLRRPTAAESREWPDRSSAIRGPFKASCKGLRPWANVWNKRQLETLGTKLMTSTQKTNLGIWKHLKTPSSKIWNTDTAGIGCCRWRFCQESCRSAGQMGCGSAKEVPGAEGCSDFVSSRRWAGSLLSCVLVRSHSGTLCYSILVMELMYAVFIFWYTLLKFWCSLFLLLLLWWWWRWWFCLPHLLWIGWGCFYKQDNSWKRKLRDWCKRTRRQEQAGVLNGPNHLHNISWRV